MNNLDIFPWQNDYEVGVEEIDNQHKMLVNLINNICGKMFDVMMDQKIYKQIISDSLRELLDYTTYHFEYEENEYKRYLGNTKILKKHTNSHKELILSTQQFLTAFDADSDSFEIEKFISTLVLWLSKHILTEDMFMFSVVANLVDGRSFENAVRLAKESMHGTKGEIAKIITAMMQVSTAISLNLRREITSRKMVEKDLKHEILIRKEAEKKLKNFAQHDALTGLANRRLFEELCGLSLRFAKRNQYEQAVLFVDIDHFKFVNDTMGHKAGDALLVSIAKRLEKCVRASDIVARMGGDEFTIHLGGECSEDDARAISSNIIASISKPFKLVEGTANVSASVGVSMYPNDAEDIETLIRNADAAMYLAKKSGKNAYKFFKDSRLKSANTVPAPIVSGAPHMLYPRQSRSITV